MTINKTVNGNEVTIKIEGRLDTTTAPEFENEVNSVLDTAEKLVFDLKDLDYVSSAGLRVLLIAQKNMSSRGCEMIVTGCSEDIMEIFEVTGFADILTIV